MRSVLCKLFLCTHSLAAAENPDGLMMLQTQVKRMRVLDIGVGENKSLSADEMNVALKAFLNTSGNMTLNDSLNTSGKTTLNSSLNVSRNTSNNERANSSATATATSASNATLTGHLQTPKNDTGSAMSWHSANISEKLLEKNAAFAVASVNTTGSVSSNNSLKEQSNVSANNSDMTANGTTNISHTPAQPVPHAGRAAPHDQLPTNSTVFAASSANLTSNVSQQGNLSDRSNSSGTSESLGAIAMLDEAGYQKVAALKSNAEMEKFILRTLESLDITVTNTGHRALRGFVPFYSGVKAKGSFVRLSNEVSRISKIPRAWLSCRGNTASLNEVGFAAVQALRSNDEMAIFAGRVANDMMNLEVLNTTSLAHFVKQYSGDQNRKGYDILQIDLAAVGHGNDTWLVPRTAPLQHAGEDCFDPCNKTGGYCGFCGKGNACCRKGWEKNPSECTSAMNYLTAKHECTAIATGAFAPLSEAGYAAVSMLQNDTQMERFVRRTAAALDITVKSDLSLRGFVPFYSGSKSKKSYAVLTAELTKISSHPNSWLAPRGSTAPLTEAGYATVAALGSSLEMAQFVHRTTKAMKLSVKNEAKLRGMVPYYSGERTKSNFSNLQAELHRVSAQPNSWLVSLP